MRILVVSLLAFILLSLPGMAMEQKWIDELNQRFPGIGHEFQQAVEQKLAQHGGTLSVGELLEKLVSSPDYNPDQIANANAFGLHSELMLLYPAVGKYQEALHEAKLLRDFVLEYSSHDLKVVQTFRGVYVELLIVNEQYEEALQESDKIIALNPDEEGNYLGRGVLFVKLGQLDEAMDALKILIQKPEAARYAQQLFVFIMQNREKFQETQVQKNTMIDVMLRGLEPESQPKIRIPGNLDEHVSINKPEQKAPQQQTTEVQIPKEKPEEPKTGTSVKQPPTAPPKEQPAVDTTIDPIAKLLPLNAEQITQVLGPPLSEDEGDSTLDRDYTYQEHTLTIGFDKANHNIVSLQMFFLPLVDEATAFTRIGLLQRDLPPLISSDVLKVWSPYGNFSKVRLSLNEGKVIAIIVEP